MKFTTAWCLSVATLAVNARLERRPQHRLARRADHQIYTGLGFWGHQNGQKGNCGEVHDDEFLLAGLQTTTYATGQFCGKYIEILNGENNKTVVARVSDSCNGDCTEAGDIYLSPGAFEKIADLDTGVIRVAWTFVQDPNAKVDGDLKDHSFVDKTKTKSTRTEEGTAPTPETVVEKKVPEPETPKATPVEEKTIAQPKEAKVVEKKPAAPKETHSDEVKAPKKEESKKEESAPETPAKKPTSSSSGSLRVGLAWAVDDRWATGLADGLDKWYMHWADGPVSQLDQAGWEFYPMLWSGGSAQVAAFEKNMAAVNYKPKYILGHNEPDIPSQANTSPEQAAQEWKQHIEKYAGSGAKLVSPAPAWNVEWLKSFMKACSDCTVDAIGLHSYDPYDASASKFKARVQEFHQAFPNHPILILEYGLQSSSQPNVQQSIAYMRDTINWMRGLGYVSHAAWFGAFSPNTNPDGYAANSATFFNNDGSLSQFGQAYKSV